jgi:general secretion pathway protein C
MLRQMQPRNAPRAVEMDSRKRQTGNISWALILVCSAAIAFLGHDLHRTVRRVLSLPTQSESHEATGQGLERASLRPKADYHVIARRNLFAFPQGAEAGGKDSQMGEGPAETRLDVRLRGTIVGPRGLALALMEDPAQRKEDLVGVGNEIRGARVVRILPDQVILERRGRSETITLFSEGPSTGPVSASPPAVARSGTVSALSAPEVASDALAPPSETSRDIPNLMAQLKLRPHLEGGNPSGFAVGRVLAGSLFEAAGLREGDVIIAINEEETRTSQELRQTYRMVKEDTELWLDIRRNGEERTIEIDFEP